jgi:hypothetical protein
MLKCFGFIHLRKKSFQIQNPKPIFKFKSSNEEEEEESSKIFFTHPIREA